MSSCTVEHPFVLRKKMTQMTGMIPLKLFPPPPAPEFSLPFNYMPYLTLITINDSVINTSYINFMNSSVFSKHLCNSEYLNNVKSTELCYFEL